MVNLGIIALKALFSSFFFTTELIYLKFTDKVR